MAEEISTADTDEYLAALGNKIRSFREALGWSPEELGRQAGGIPKTTIWRLETGKQPNPKLFQLLPIAEALGYELRDLLPGGSEGAVRHSEKVKEAMDRLREQAATEVAAAREQTAQAVREAEEAARSKARASETAARKKVEDAAKADRDELRQLRQTCLRMRRSLEKALAELDGGA